MKIKNLYNKLLSRVNDLQSVFYMEVLKDINFKETFFEKELLKNIDFSGKGVVILTKSIKYTDEDVLHALQHKYNLKFNVDLSKTTSNNIAILFAI